MPTLYPGAAIWGKAGVSLLILVMLVSAAVSTVEATHGRALVTTWSRTYSKILENPDSVEITSDGGFIVAGERVGAWVLKAGASGLPEWEMQYTPTGYTVALATSIKETRDHGYIVAGAALSQHYVTGLDAWLFKLNRHGRVLWSQTYGGQRDDYFSSVALTSDGGYVAVGNTQSFGSLHASNGWVVKADSEGRIVWQETFEGQDIYSVDRTRDGGFVLAGTVGISENADAWIVKLDANGGIVWQKAFQGRGYIQGYSVQQTMDGGYVVAAEATTLTTVGTFASSDTLILRLDDSGNAEWMRDYSGGGFTRPGSITQAFDGGFIVAGVSRPSPYYGGNQGPWLFKLDAEGTLVWQKTYGSLGDEFYQVQAKSNGEIIVSGFRLSLGSAWVLSLDTRGSIAGCSQVIATNATISGASVIRRDSAVASAKTTSFEHSTSVSSSKTGAIGQTLCISIPAPRSKGTVGDSRESRLGELELGLEFGADSRIPSSDRAV